MSLTTLTYLGTALMLGAPLIAVLAGPDEWTSPGAAEVHQRRLTASCLTAQALGAGLQILAAVRARVGGGHASPGRDSMLLAVIVVLSSTALACVGSAVSVLLRSSSDVGGGATPGLQGDRDR